MSSRKLIMYISMSLDGFIATKDDDLSWLEAINLEGEDYGYFDFTGGCDTYIVGKGTYDVVLKLTGGVFAQAKQYDCYVITRQELPSKDGVTFYNGDLDTLVQGLKKKEGKNIYFDGGGQVTKLLMEKDLIDEYIISVIPIVLGDGKRLFLGETPQLDLTLVSAKPYASGLVQMHYRRVNSKRSSNSHI